MNKAKNLPYGFVCFLNQEDALKLMNSPKYDADTNTIDYSYNERKIHGYYKSLKTNIYTKTLKDSVTIEDIKE